MERNRQAALERRRQAALRQGVPTPAAPLIYQPVQNQVGHVPQWNLPPQDRQRTWSAGTQWNQPPSAHQVFPHQSSQPSVHAPAAQPSYTPPGTYSPYKGAAPFARSAVFGAMAPLPQAGSAGRWGYPYNSNSGPINPNNNYSWTPAVPPSFQPSAGAPWVQPTPASNRATPGQATKEPAWALPSTAMPLEQARNTNYHINSNTHQQTVVEPAAAAATPNAIVVPKATEAPTDPKPLKNNNNFFKPKPKAKFSAATAPMKKFSLSKKNYGPATTVTITAPDPSKPKKKLTQATLGETMKRYRENKAENAASEITPNTGSKYEEHAEISNSMNTTISDETPTSTGRLARAGHGYPPSASGPISLNPNSAIRSAAPGSSMVSLWGQKRRPVISPAPSLLASFEQTAATPVPQQRGRSNGGISPDSAIPSTSKLRARSLLCGPDDSSDGAPLQQRWPWLKGICKSDRGCPP